MAYFKHKFPGMHTSQPLCVYYVECYGPIMFFFMLERPYNSVCVFVFSMYICAQSTGIYGLSHVRVNACVCLDTSHFSTPQGDLVTAR